jgi:predicted membrane protein (TIGR00267 family)
MSKTLDRWKTYWQISQAGEIIRRYFVMNFFDGILTALGIVLGFFTTNLAGIPASRTQIVSIALATAIAIGISGLTGSHMAESAERRIKVIEMKQLLGLIDKDGNESNNSSKPANNQLSTKELEMALGKFNLRAQSKQRVSALQSIRLGLTPKQSVKLRQLQLESEEIDATKEEIISEITKKPSEAEDFLKISKGQPLIDKKKSQQKDSKQKNDEIKEKEKEKETTLYEESQEFASKIAAIIDGFSPFAGVVVVVIPFLLATSASATNFQFIACFVITGIVLFILGSYLAIISRENIYKFGFQMVLAAVLTSILSLLLNLYAY